MAYKYMSASAGMVKSPKESYIGDFAQILLDDFENSTDWFTVQEEFPVGSEEYRDVDVRVNYVVSNETGEKLSDDYKLLYFKELDHYVRLGQMFFFDDNYWIVINTERVKSLTSTATVKRCNNTLRWMDALGGIYNEPCTLGDNLIRENRDYSTTGSAVVNVSGNIEVVCQFNERTNKIQANQRFLFGNPSNWYAYKVFGGGVNNLNLMNTHDFYSAGLIRLSMGANQENPDSDDLINGVCDINQETYSVLIEQGDLNLNVGQQIQLDASVKLNGVVVERNFTWVSNDESVALVSSDGIVTALQSGIARIYCYLQNNTVVYDTVDVYVDSSPNTNALVVYEPLVNSILQGTSETFSVYLEKNGVRQLDIFSFSVFSTNVPTTKYTLLTVDGNHFTVTNLKMYLTEPLVIRCTSGTYQKDISILLKGGW